VNDLNRLYWGPINNDRWVPACGGKEVPFETRTGRRLHYMWNMNTGEHAYYDLDRDIFLSNAEADEAFGF
jgi:hypothetical protein